MADDAEFVWARFTRQCMTQHEDPVRKGYILLRSILWMMSFTH